MARPRKRVLPRRRWTNPLAWAVWNQRRLNKERSAGGVIPPESCRYFYNFDGVDDYISCNIPLVAGDELSFEYIAPSSYDSVQSILWDNNVNQMYARIESSTLISKAGFSSLTIDGVEFVNGTPLPTDGLAHTVVVTAEITGVITFFGCRSTLANFIDFTAFNIKLNDGLVFNYAVDDNSNIIANSGTGADALLINGTPEQWEYICETPAGAFGDEFGDEFG